MSNGAQFGGMEATPEEEMRAFDSLPKELQDLLNWAHLDWSAKQLAAAPTGGSKQMGSFTITTRDERGELVKKIVQEEPKVPPLKTPQRLEQVPKLRGRWR